MAADISLFQVEKLLMYLMRKMYDIWKVVDEWVEVSNENSSLQKNYFHN